MIFSVKYQISKYFILILFLFILNCDSSTDNCPRIEYPPDTYQQITISQGIWGNVWFWEGDFQPICIQGKITPVAREVCIYKGTPIDSVIRFQNSFTFFTEIKTTLVKVTRSNSTGFFEAELPPGAYSLFIKEDSLFYANGGDNQYILPAYVSGDSLTKVQIDITYKAVF